MLWSLPSRARRDGSQRLDPVRFRKFLSGTPRDEHLCVHSDVLIAADRAGDRARARGSSQRKAWTTRFTCPALHLLRWNAASYSSAMSSKSRPCLGAACCPVAPKEAVKLSCQTPSLYLTSGRGWRLWRTVMHISETYPSLLCAPLARLSPLRVVLRTADDCASADHRPLLACVPAFVCFRPNQI